MKRKELKISDLNQIYSDAESVDQDHFSEQRSNILLISGEHYAKKNSKFWNKVRESRDLSSEQKLRLTKNHIQKITKTYINNIISHAPSVTIVPKNQSELQDQKSAELNKSVWQDLRDKHDLRLKTQKWCKDFIDLGEVAVKVFWNPNKGKIIGYQPEMDEMGQPLMDEQGQPVPSKTPVFSGDLEYERVWGFNLLRAPTAKEMSESEYLIIRKMVDIETAKEMVGDDEEKLKMLTASKDDTYLVFDGSSKSYRDTDKQVLFKEFYFRPCQEYPNGYYYITTNDGILFEGELPFGIFPIVYEGFDEVQTTPRHKSIVKQLRPYQAEINRTASKIAETQTTSDDKLLVHSGTQITNGGTLSGVRTLQYQGATPTPMAGRAGEQYLPYMQSQISEIYQVANVNEDEILKDMKLDPFGALFSSLRNKKKFTIYAERFESFLLKVCETSLRLAKEYYNDYNITPAIGKNEYINISEFKNSSDLCYLIKLEPMSDDIETMMGRQLAINHALQYVGGNLEKEDIGKLIRAMPLGNLDESFSDLTLNYDSATNIILALDRGESVLPNKYDKAEYMITRLTDRMRKSDFKLLHPEIQDNYQRMVIVYEQILVERQRELAAAESEFIPRGGARIKVDYYVPDPNNSSRSVRATLPAESLDWLIKQLAAQGSTQETLAALNQGAVSEMAALFNQQQAQGPQGLESFAPAGLGLPLS
jgi:hypothetical protein